MLGEERCSGTVEKMTEGKGLLCLFSKLGTGLISVSGILNDQIRITSFLPCYLNVIKVQKDSGASV